MKHPAIELITESVEAPDDDIDAAPPAAALSVDGTLLLIPAGGAVVGRSQTCDVVIDLPSVSRRHAWIRPVNGHWAVQDIGSTNHVRLNGARLAGAQWLRSGDELQLGRARTKFVVEG